MLPGHNERLLLFALGELMKNIKQTLKVSIGFLMTMVVVGCGEAEPTFSLLPDTEVFYQNSSTINNKLDVLWVIDNSGSMQDEQDALAANFSSFINNFVTKGFDFRLGVTVTDAWRAPYVGNPSLAQLKDRGQSGVTGIRVITPSTPNLLSVFQTNINQGTSGNGDERAFSSFREALNSGLNVDFRRPDGFLAIIIVSDEDDFSWSGSSSLNRNYGDARLHTVASYTNYLDGLTQSTGLTRKYSVSAITIKDQACLDNNSWGVIGQRYIQLANETRGVIGDICGDFAQDLEAISNGILRLSTQFYLSREPVPSTIRVFVNGALVPNDPLNGWTYDPATISIIFGDNAIPPQGSAIGVDFDPVSPL